jgi:hypothetical protein
MGKKMPESTPELTPEQRYQARQIFEKTGGSCVHCGGVHLRACRRVREITWHADGTCIGAKYWHDGEWDDSNTVWPEDAYDEDVNDDFADRAGREEPPPPLRPI